LARFVHNALSEARLVKKFALILMVIAALAAPASALASDGYTNVPGVSGTAGGPTSSPGNEEAAAVAGSSESSGSSVLPFTGAELAAMLGVGVVLLGAGLVLRRRAQTH
jgi:hypothetical protein